MERDPALACDVRTLVVGSGASRRTVERLFRAQTGMSLGAWRQQLRLRHALTRLGAGDSVTAAGLDAGYASTSAFIAAFKSTFGATPGTLFPLTRSARHIARR